MLSPHTEDTYPHKSSGTNPLNVSIQMPLCWFISFISFPSSSRPHNNTTPSTLKFYHPSKFSVVQGRHNQGFSNYQRDGLLKSLAEKYLGDDTCFDCSCHGGIFSTKKCNIACSDVLKIFNDVSLGRKVYFSLAAAIGFSQVMGDHACK